MVAIDVDIHSPFDQCFFGGIMKKIMFAAVSKKGHASIANMMNSIKKASTIFATEK